MRGILLHFGCLIALNNAASPPERPQNISGGIVNIAFMLKNGGISQQLMFTPQNSTMFTHSAPLPPTSGIWGEVIPFHPLDACSKLRSSNYTKKVGNTLQFTTMGPSPHVIALVARGKCSFEEKFDNVDNVPNVVGMIMFDLEDGVDLSNDIEISTFKPTTIPAFLISYKMGQMLLERINDLRDGQLNEKEGLWIKATLQYIPFSGALADALEYVLITLLAVVAVIFIVSIIMHYRIYRRRMEVEESHLHDSRHAVKIDETFLQKLPVRRFHTNQGCMGAEVEKSAPIEQDYSHSSTPPNETCPICLDEFEEGESLNELPCGHYYHILCIHPWLLNRSPECPLCKVDVRDAYIDSAAENGDSSWKKLCHKVLSCGQSKKSANELPATPSENENV